MTNVEGYAAAHLPDTWRIMGQRLQPVTIGHGLLLQRVGSPWMPFSTLPVAGSVPPLGDLLLALWILAQPWRKAVARLPQRRCRWVLKAWELQAVWLSEATLTRHGDRLRAFMEASIAPPAMWSGKGSAGPRSQAPTLATLKVQIQSSLHIGNEAALDTPIAVALWDLLTHAEGKGAIQFKSNEEMEAHALLISADN